MSGDVFSSIDPSESKPVEFKQHCSIYFKKEDYCLYSGTCEKDRLIIGKEFSCLMCKYRRPLDIPEMIKEALHG